MVRRNGLRSTAGDLKPNDHVCWVYTDDEEFLEAGLSFLADGLTAGQRVMYVSERTRSWMLDKLSRLEPAERLLARGALTVTPIWDLYDPHAPALPEKQLTTYAIATGRALAEGYTGLRVLAEITELVAEPDRHTDYARWEHLADHYVAAGHPVTVLCAINGRHVDHTDVTDIATLHPLVCGPDGLAEFRLFFDGDRLALAGTVDTYGSSRLRRLLAVSHLREPKVTLDISQVEFIDARVLHALFHWGSQVASQAGRVIIEGGSAVTYRAWRALHFDRTPGLELARAAR
jgi:anti-anti-sigma regulatory factor